MSWDREMVRALEADGEKLRQMTGEDHGPVFVAACESCYGLGEIFLGLGRADGQTAERCDACGGTGDAPTKERT